ncbi:hypothetical protein [Cohnella caldifontis]|uniref:hypothetical protein n=1 Tax=Cohnella caldifontis TaxID=3027471 RepID=UPI0023ED0E2E|nr:hypothetical protein [Cohnella sp. YIM B05605]
MAWEAAGYAAAMAFVVTAFCMTALALKAIRTLSRVERHIDRLAGKADNALDQHAKLAQEACEAAVEARRSLEGFARFAEGARAVGQAAESAALAAASTVSRWRDRISSWAPGTSADPTQESE